MSMHNGSGLIVFLFVTGLISATARTKPRKYVSGLVYGPLERVRWFLVLTIVGFAGGAFYVAITPPRSLLGVLIFGFISLAGVWSFPSDIIVSSKSVTAVRLWGSRTTILWSDVSEIKFRQSPRDTAIIGKNGERVIHSGFNRDWQGFRAICVEKTGITPNVSRLER
ncbi:hypothetical protein EDE15_3718 [Edaphobacter aggregans]|uniref:PH (Pleckstrin Homology) domain-containing protein n=1 Tax=Edaphobacter aggregans TaxID=570835 RepID=A0A428MMU9_9BACT|nr:hypothetical protein EDE15_3718 [Edaphobacter aggregans]